MNLREEALSGNLSESLADIGHWCPEYAQLSQNSQKAIVSHNKKEEVLIVGTELKAGKEIGVLEIHTFYL